jgi:hypothetical protein
MDPFWPRSKARPATATLGTSTSTLVINYGACLLTFNAVLYSNMSQSIPNRRAAEPTQYHYIRFLLQAEK